MNDQPRDPKQVPPDAGAEQPTVEQPTAQAGAAERPTTQAEPAAPAQPEAAPASAEGTPEAPTAAPEVPGAPSAAAQAQEQPGAVPPADQTAVHGEQAPPTPQLSQPGPGQAYAAWGPPPAAGSRPPGGFRRFVGHRATQLVGVGVLGVLVGGVVVGGIAAVTHHGPRDGRPGIHRQYDGPAGNHGFDGRGPGFGGRGGNSGNSGSGDGI